MDNNHSDISKPEKFGPPLWYTIHISALKMGEDAFISWITIIIDSIPCLKCRNHAKEYFKNNPPELFKGIYDENSGELIGMFKWTWKFHNDVNIRLGKKVLPFEVAYDMYKNDDTLCSSDCG